MSEEVYKVENEVKEEDFLFPAGECGKREEDDIFEQPHPTCIFCQRKASNYSCDKGGIPRAEINTCSSLLLTFNQLWPYLQNNCKDSETLISFIETNFIKTKPVSLFTSLPIMCIFCCAELEKVDTHLQILWLAIKKISSAIQKSRTSELHSYGTCENSSLPMLLADDTMNDYDIFRAPCSISGEVDEFGAEEDSENKIEYNSYPDYIKSEQEDIHSSDSEFESVNTQLIKLSPKLNKVTKIPAQSISNMNEIKEEDLFICEASNCGKTFPTRKSAQKHQQDFHKIRKDFQIRPYCTTCRKIFSGITKLKNHKISAHATKSSDLAGVKCDLCRDIVLEKDMITHMLEHVSEEYIIKCPNKKCRLAYTKPVSLFRHLSQNRTCWKVTPDEAKPKKTENCEICEYASISALDLRSHLTRNHENPTKNYSCPISGCEQSFTVKQSVVLHLPHHDFSQFLSYQNCALCSEQAKVDNMGKHLKDKHQVSKIIKCKQCSFLFSTREQLLEHMFDHRFGELLCDICEDGVKYARHNNLREHYFTVHKIGQKISCEVCGNEFWDKQHWQAHVKSQHKDSSAAPGESKKIFRCGDCGVEYKTETSLQSHNIREHGADPLTCSFCVETFFHRETLAKHVRDHKGVRTDSGKEFKCKVEECGKIFNSSNALLRHNKAIHLGVRHVCDICGKSYLGMWSLNHHKKSVHLGLRPYVCDECGESFVTSTILKRHKFMHTGDRPFECEVCGQRFRHKEVLKTHLQGHERKGRDFKPIGQMKQRRKRVEKKKNNKS